MMQKYNHEATVIQQLAQLSDFLTLPKNESTNLQKLTKAWKLFDERHPTSDSRQAIRSKAKEIVSICELPAIECIQDAVKGIQLVDDALADNQLTPGLRPGM